MHTSLQPYAHTDFGSSPQHIHTRLLRAASALLHTVLIIPLALPRRQASGPAALLRRMAAYPRLISTNPTINTSAEKRTPFALRIRIHREYELARGCATVFGTVLEEQNALPG